MSSYSNGFEFFSHGDAVFKGTVCVIGSTRFFDEFMELNRFLTLNGWFVLACGQWGHSYHSGKHYTYKRSLDLVGVKRLHLHKIVNSDVVVVCTNDSGYTGESTKYEQRFAQHLKKPIFVWNGNDFTSGRCYQVFDDSNGWFEIDQFINHPYTDANPIPH